MYCNIFFNYCIVCGKLYVVMKMKDFFTFYRDIKHMDLPFEAFQLMHGVLLIVSVGIILYVVRCYGRMDEHRQHRFMKGMAIYYLMEEGLYTIWLLLVCSDHVWLRILPLELCSLCAYMNAIAVFTKNRYLQFYSGVIPLIAGSIALLYPANISNLYPVISYRVLNFYMLHGSFILFSLIQLRDKKLLQYRYMRRNMLLVGSMYTIAFIVNLALKTQYMFVGIPPEIGFVANVFHVTGVIMFLPVIIAILCLLQFLVVYLLRKICHTQPIAKP